ncbi:MAG TPA: hypothetical protein DHV62_01590 [Elusimicrobia bacterium]|nr:hypothetical protein [Elusimicrobiota bacterium]
MDKKRFFLIILFGFLLTIITSSPQRIYAQEKTNTISNLKIPDSNHIQILITIDGAANLGRIIEIGTDEIQFQTEIGKLTIPLSKIKEIKEVPADSIRKGEYWYANPNTTRLFFSPTGRMLRKGEGYFADYYLFFPAITYGITDNITIGGGMSLFPGADIDEQIFYLTPKVGLKAGKNLNLAIGALLIKVPKMDNEGSTTDNSETVDNPEGIGILYGVGTYGTADASFTLGLGYGFVDNDFADKPMLVIGGEKRLTTRIALVTENWIFPEIDNPLVSCGIRFFGEKLSVDLALINTLSKEAVFPGFPYVDFVFNF